MKKSKSMFENGNIYSGDDEGFESSPEKVLMMLYDPIIYKDIFRTQFLLKRM